MKKVKTKKIRKGKIKRERLSPEMEKWAKDVHGFLGNELVGPYEQFEFSFCHDKNPQREIFVWHTIAAALEQCVNIYPTYDRKEMYKQLLFFTISGNTDENAIFPKEIRDEMEKIMIEQQHYLLEQIKNQ